MMIDNDNSTENNYFGPAPENLTYLLSNISAEGSSKVRAPASVSAELPAYIRIAATTVCAVILTLGTAGNILVATVVWKTKELRNSTNLFLINLSLADLMVLLVCVPPVLVELHSMPEVWIMGEGMCKAVPYVQLTAAHGSVLTILAISFERYYAICQPLKAGYTCTQMRALAIIVAICFLRPALPHTAGRLLSYRKAPNGGQQGACLFQRRDPNAGQKTGGLDAGSGSSQFLHMLVTFQGIHNMVNSFGTGRYHQSGHGDLLQSSVLLQAVSLHECRTQPDTLQCHLFQIPQLFHPTPEMLEHEKQINSANHQGHHYLEHCYHQRKREERYLAVPSAEQQAAESHGQQQFTLECWTQTRKCMTKVSGLVD
ncbi:Orexin receptor type 2 like protein [Argiope bruennichi]|uniref:Orexin receptor type 2 like protein n=1 Tax=Argiope bruennichi TaxID=94029 RepID=A0A8T0ELB3_ARGBR|nr:Orexin receptor type 2 like protein [Argiope bruennichi]